MNLRLIVLSVFVSLLLCSCELNDFDSEARPVAETVYMTALSVPDWAENRSILRVNLNPEYTIDSLSKDLSFIRRNGVKILLLENVQNTVLDTLFIKSPKKVILNSFAPDTMIGNMDNLKGLMNQARNKGLKLMMDFNFCWTYENSNPEYPNLFINWDEKHFKYNPTEKNFDFIKESISFWRNEMGFDGFYCNEVSELPNSVWEEVRAIFSDEDLLLMGEFKDQNLLNKTFNYQVDVNPLLYDIEDEFKKIQFMDRKSLVDFPVHRDSVERSVLKSAFINHNSYLIEWSELRKLSEEKISYVLNLSDDFRRENENCFMAGSQYNHRVQEFGSIEIYERKNENEVKFIMNQTDSMINYKELNEVLYYDYFADTAVVNNLNIPAYSYRLLYSKRP